MTQLTIPIILILTLLLFSGCTKPEIEYREKKVYIKSQCKEYVALDPVPPFSITDYVDLNATHYAINKDQFIGFSDTCYTHKYHNEYYRRAINE